MPQDDESNWKTWVIWRYLRTLVRQTTTTTVMSRDHVIAGSCASDLHELPVGACLLHYSSLQTTDIHFGLTSDFILWLRSRVTRRMGLSWKETLLNFTHLDFIFLLETLFSLFAHFDLQKPNPPCYWTDCDLKSLSKLQGFAILTFINVWRRLNCGCSLVRSSNIEK